MDEEAPAMFLEAAAGGDLDQIMSIISASEANLGLVNVHHPQTGNTALILATEGRFPQVVDFLLERGADVTLRNFSHRTAVHVATEPVRGQLLSALRRASFPRLGLAQAAWQGDLEAVRHLLSAEPAPDVNLPNEQGFTPLMLAMRDTELFDQLLVDYRPLDVVQELLKHNANPRLCDSSGKSVSFYASEVTGSMRQQLIDVLNESLSSPGIDTQNEAGAFCPETKPPLLNSPTSTDETGSAAQICSPGPQVCSERISTESIKRKENCDRETETENPEAVPRIMSGLQRRTFLLQDIDGIKRNGMQKTSLPRLWHTEPLPRELTSSKLTNDHFPPMRPSHRKKDEGPEQRKSLGLAYLLYGSRSEPNITETLRANPLTDIADIKQHISQRLGPTGSTRSNEMKLHVPASCHSPRSVRLPPLIRNRSRTKDEIDLSAVVLSLVKPADEMPESPTPAQRSPEGFPQERSSFQLRHWDFSTGRVTVSAENLEPSHLEEAKLFQDVDQEEVNETDRRIQNVSESASQTGRELEVQDVVLVNESTSNINVNESKTDKHLMDGSELKDAEGLHPFRTSTPEPVSFVLITFSEQKPQCSSNVRPTRRKGNICGVPHNVNHSFNINAQKENEKPKKNKRLRNKSAPESSLKNHPRPLSNSKKINIKSVPVPTLGLLVPRTIPKTSKKVQRLEESSFDKSSQKSHARLPHFKKKSNPLTKSPSPLSGRSRTAIGMLTYDDMYKEMTPQKGGPGMFEMFPTDLYGVGTCKEGDEPGRTSISSNKRFASASAKSLSANDTKGRTQKRPNSKTRKSSSALSQKHRSSLKTEKATKDDQTNTRDNVVIISGMDWQIKAIKQEDFNKNKKALGVSEAIGAGQQNGHYSELSIIKEATLEKSLSMSGRFRGTFHQMILEMGQSPGKEIDQRGISEQSKEELSEDDDDDDDGQRGINHEEDVQNVPTPETRDLLERGAHEKQLAEGSFGNSKSTGGNFYFENHGKKSCSEDEGDAESACTIAKLFEDICTDPDSESTDELIRHLMQQISSIDEKESSLSKTLPSTKTESETQKSQEQHENLEKGGKTPDSKERNKSESLNTDNNSNNLNLDEGICEFNHKTDGAISWIKGEMLGRGAYGTVYCGLTSQGELIAAKQVALDASDPATAKKEYNKLQEEVDLLKTLKHENIVGYLGTSLQDNVVTIFMEFVPGGSISSILKQFGPLHEIVISRYTKHILRGIAYLHNNRVIHRDVKGNNVMLMPNGILKLIDFGCAKRLTRLSMSGTHNEVLKSMHGTPYWMAPEVITESGHGAKSDIWSIGCTVFEMATGKPPLAYMNKMAAMYYIATGKGFMPTLPDHFSIKARNFVNLCLTRDQNDRPSAEQLLQHPFVKRKL
ncbi:mitogen-activated protein kinase kinase kinase 19 [Spea bombifrons]|uniref:mitogen-activated protein kinase kinase kinase 19 n=1 Tax=Spea bombifrons TaxID=233779 RepID=UPI00234BAF9A|nr:mitogen-activated protein kinase kinase kinase 19 [Spea bombifrons]